MIDESAERSIDRYQTGFQAEPPQFVGKEAGLPIRISRKNGFRLAVVSAALSLLPLVDVPWFGVSSTTTDANSSAIEPVIIHPDYQATATAAASVPVVYPTAVIINNDQKQEAFRHAEAIDATLRATIRPEILNKVRRGTRLAEILSSVAAVKQNNGDVRAINGSLVMEQHQWLLGASGDQGYNYLIESADFDFEDPELASIFNSTDNSGFSLELDTKYINADNLSAMGLPRKWYMSLTPRDRSIDLSSGGVFQLRRLADKMLNLRGPRGELGQWSMPRLIPDVSRPQTENGYHHTTVQHDVYSEGKKNPKTGEASNWRSVSAEITDYGQFTYQQQR